MPRSGPIASPLPFDPRRARRPAKCRHRVRPPWRMAERRAKQSPADRQRALGSFVLLLRRMLARGRISGLADNPAMCSSVEGADTAKLGSPSRKRKAHGQVIRPAGTIGQTPHRQRICPVRSPRFPEIRRTVALAGSTGSSAPAPIYSRAIELRSISPDDLPYRWTPQLRYVETSRWHLSFFAGRHSDMCRSRNVAPCRAIVASISATRRSREQLNAAHLVG